MRAKLLLGLLAFAMPVSGQTPSFSVTLVCDGPVPVSMSIKANRVATLEFTISELLDRCAAEDSKGSANGKAKEI
jgi:hypothetical protein